MKLSDSDKQHFEGMIKKIPDGCWLFTGTNNGMGYGVIRIGGEQQKAHRVAYVLYVNNIPEGICICHTCDNPICVNPAHLFAGTQKDNMQDMKAKGRHGYGETNSRAKLKEHQVIEIRKRYATDKYIRQEILAKEYNISRSALSFIVTNKTWKYLLPEESA